MMDALDFFAKFLELGRRGADTKASWWKLRYRGRGQKKQGVRKIGVLRPWQVKLWFSDQRLGESVERRARRLGMDRNLLAMFDATRQEAEAAETEQAAKKVPITIETRQRKRAALRKLCMTQITEKYGAEPRIFRRRIARRLAVKAFGEMKVAA